jgi:hypothetical protein
LAEYLNANGRGLHFQVVNFGINSFNSLFETKYLEKALIEQAVRPDLIVFYDGANDTKYFVEHRTADGHYGYRRVRALIEGYYASWFGLLKPVNAAIQASFTRELYDKLNQVAFPLDPSGADLRTMVDKTVQRYDFASRLAEGFGAKFALVWQPMLWTEGCAVSPAVADGERTVLINSDRLAAMRRNFTAAYSAIGGGLAGKPYFTSFSAALCGRSVPFYQADGVHLTDLAGAQDGLDVTDRPAITSTCGGNGRAFDVKFGGAGGVFCQVDAEFVRASRILAERRQALAQPAFAQHAGAP